MILVNKLQKLNNWNKFIVLKNKKLTILKMYMKQLQKNYVKLTRYQLGNY
jgi:hypothetical protein